MVTILGCNTDKMNSPPFSMARGWNTEKMTRSIKFSPTHPNIRFRGNTYEVEEDSNKVIVRAPSNPLDWG